MDLRELECFVRVAEFGSFSKAATVLSVGQPVLSKRIRCLENELNERLFRRNGRGIELSQEGTAFLPYAKAALRELGQGRIAIANIKASPVGKVTVGAIPDSASALTTLLETFSQRFPKASLDIIQAKSWAVHEYLLAGRIDIGVLYDPPASAAIGIIPLMAQKIYFVSSRKNPMADAAEAVEFSDLPKMPLILPPNSHPFRALVDAAAAKAGIELNVVQTVTGATFVLELVSKGHGCTLQSEEIVRRSNLGADLQLNSLVGCDLHKTLTLGISANPQSPRLVHEVVALISSIVKADMLPAYGASNVPHAPQETNEREALGDSPPITSKLRSLKFASRN